MNTERFTTVGPLRLCWTAIGDPDDPTVLLIMGAGLTLDWWPAEFCTELAARGFRVVRFDNRDVGRSTHWHGRGVSAWEFLTRRADPAYTIADMADDAAGLVAELDPRGAHVVGVSMGALIAQELAIRRPATTRSLVSIMGRPGDRGTGRMSRRRIPGLLRPPLRDPVENAVRTFRLMGSTGRTIRDDEDARTAARGAAARAEPGDGRGDARHVAACIADRDRTADLRGLDCPTLVVHGLRDRVVTPSGGRATAAAIPGAELLEIAGMGHDLPRRVWPPLLDGIARTAARAAEASRG